MRCALKDLCPPRKVLEIIYYRRAGQFQVRKSIPGGTFPGHTSCGLPAGMANGELWLATKVQSSNVATHCYREGFV